MRPPVPIGVLVIGVYHSLIGGLNLLALGLLMIAAFTTAILIPPSLGGGLILVLLSFGLIFFAALHLSVGVGLWRGNRAALVGAIVLSGLLALGGAGIGAVEGEIVGLGSCLFHGGMTIYLLFSKTVHAAFSR
ncbi:MAG: hypothetical protein JKY65_09000 [Planctomycetes bacterium]|nr:hypothetical protein [Planctomycetota bacterium]